MKTMLFSAATLLLLTACGGQSSSDTPNASAPAASSALPAQSTASASLAERISNKGTITVGTEGTYAPFTYHDADGKLTGYDVEVTRALAAKLGVQVEFKETQWDSMLAGLKAGRFDMVANQVGLSSPERKATFDKSEPDSWSGAVLVVRRDETRIKSPSDVKGVKTAQTLSSNFGEMARAQQAEIIPIDGLAQAITVIQQKRADATFNDELSILDFLKKNPNANIKIVWTAPASERVGSGLIVNKGNDAALVQINAAMNQLKADGTLKKLGEQFFNKDISTH